MTFVGVSVCSWGARRCQSTPTYVIGELKEPGIACFNVKGGAEEPRNPPDCRLDSQIGVSKIIRGS